MVTFYGINCDLAYVYYHGHSLVWEHKLTLSNQHTIISFLFPLWIANYNATNILCEGYSV
jgi:hypothetical protein